MEISYLKITKREVVVKVYGTPVNVTSFDIHIESDGLGSNTQYNKD